MLLHRMPYTSTYMYDTTALPCLVFLYKLLSQPTEKDVLYAWKIDSNTFTT